MEEKSVGESRRAVQRSPNYPQITLEKALERARVFWDREKRNPANIAVALRHWGYGPNSGGGRTLVGALIAFGVIRDEGSGDKRQLRLSDTAIRIVLDDRPDSSERDAAIRELALTPKIYREILAAWPSLDVSDANLRHYLLIERKFNDNTVQEFIKDFRITMAFAKLPLEPDNGRVKPGGEERRTVSVGDYVRWESGGVVQFEAKRVTWVDSDFAGVEGSSTGLPLAELVTVAAPAPIVAPSSAPQAPKTHAQVVVPPQLAPQKGVGMRQEVFALAEGDVTIQWPEVLSPDSYQDFDDWIAILKRKIKRSVVSPDAVRTQAQVSDDDEQRP